MLFDAWLKEKYKIDMRTFNLRGQNLQSQMIEEYNQENRKNVH